MKIRSKFLKVVFAIIVISLVVPFSPSLSSAKAKICCKKNCKSMMRAASQAVNQGSAEQCSNESCLITDKKSESFSFVKTQETSQVDFSLAISLKKEIPQEFQFIPVVRALGKHHAPPLYLSLSTFRI